MQHKTTNPLVIRVTTEHRIYTAARWVIVVTLVALINITAGRQPWEVPGAQIVDHTHMVLLLIYALFSLLMTIGLLLPSLERLFAIAPLIDVIFLSLMSLFSEQAGLLFFPFYLFPLVSIALRQQPPGSFISGLITALLFAGAVLGKHVLLGTVDTPPDYINLTLVSVVFIFVPLLISGQLAAWSRGNQRIVDAAREQMAQAEQQIAQAKADSQAASEEVRLLYNIATSFATMSDATPDQKHILQAILDACNQLIACKAALLLKKTPDKSRTELRVEVGHALHPGDPGKVIRVEREGTLGSLLEPGAQPTLLQNIGQDSELQMLMSLHTCSAAWVVPLQFGLPTYGVMVLGTDQPQHFYAEQCEPLTILAQFAAVALRNGELLAEIKPHREKLLKSDKQAREELTRFIHDGLAQTSAQIVMKIDFLRRMIAEDPTSATKEITDIYQKIRHYHYYEVREVLTALTPLPLGQGLYTVLSQFIERKQEAYKETQIMFEADGIKNLSLHYDTENMFFNIAQESINNALKYAEAKHIWVRCKSDGTKLLMTIQDDGKGFDVEQSREDARRRGSFGLLNITDRAHHIGGEAQVLSKIGKGSFVRVVAPVQPESVTVS